MIHNIFCESNKAQETYVLCNWELKPELAEKKRSAYLAKIFYATYLCLCFASLLLSFVTSFFRTYRSLPIWFNTMENKQQTFSGNIGIMILKITK